MDTRTRGIVRQGDVLLVPVTGKRTKIIGTSVAPENGRLILARGEATGHHHSVDARCGTLTIDEGGTTYLTIDQLTGLDHQEHATIALPPRTYRVVRQREYAGPEHIRQVAD